jgi:DNA-binding LacI/PurR family transcriptional regulator
MNRSQPTIKDVAAQAGVSRQTVSRVLNDKPEVAPETRARVQDAIAALGYRPNLAARSMVVGRSCSLGCISPSLTDHTFASMIESAQDEARRRGYFMLTGSAPTVADVEPLLEEMLRRQVDGLLAIDPCADGRHRVLYPLIRRGVPLVYLSSAPCDEQVSLIRCDDDDAGYQATLYLLDLGHRAIATILGPDHEQCTFDRLDGYQRALVQAGLEPEPPLAVAGDWSAASGYRAARQLLAARRPFTAIFSQNDQMAVGAIRALREAGCRVPDHVSVIGFDDIPLASYFDPPLTTIRQPMEEFGRLGARMLIKAMDDPTRPAEQILLPGQLIIRASCSLPVVHPPG